MVEALLYLIATIFGVQLSYDNFTSGNAAFAQIISTGIAQWTTEIINTNNNFTTSVFSNSMVTGFLWFIESFAGLLFVTGIIFAFFEFAIAAHEGEKTSVLNIFLNIFKGLLATSLITVLPVLLLTFTNDICNKICQVFTSNSYINFTTQNFNDTSNFWSGWGSTIFFIIVFVCVIKVFLANLKRGGILIIQMFVGSLHIFGIPRGYVDAFWGWCRQVVGICATSFISNILIVLGAVVYSTNGGADIWDLILATGIMLSAAEAPRILQQFGLDTSVKANVSQAIFATSGITSIIRSFVR